MMIKETISAIFLSKTLIQSSFTLTSTILSGILGFLFYILSARILGPNEFGILVVAITTITLIADIGNLGTDTGIIRFVSKYLSHNQEIVLKFLKIGLEVKFIVWLLVLSLGWIILPFITENIFSKPELLTPLRLSLVGVGGALFISFITHTLQAYQKFKIWGLLNIGLNGLRLLMIFLLLAINNLNLSSVLLSYILIPFLGFIIGLFILPNFFLVRGELSIANEFFKYNRWVALFTLIAALSSRLDIYLSAKLLSTFQVGIYAAAVQMVSIIPQLIFAIATVVAPKLASFDNDKKTITYLKKLQLFTLGLALVGILLLPLSVIFIPIILGPDYIFSIQPFIILFIAQLIFLISLPTHQAIFYYFARPDLFVLVSVGHFTIMSVFGWFLISNYQVLGAAITVLIGNIFNLIVPAVWVLNKFRKSS